MSKLPPHRHIQPFSITTSLGFAVASLSMPSMVQAADQPVEDDAVTDLGTMTITEGRVSEYQSKKMSSSKYTEPLRNIPQSISVIPKRVLEEQNAQSLEDILRNVPGITFNSGEGNGGLGDSLNIRGFSGDGNVYRDGARDVGKYTRSEIFNIEQVEVVKGSSSSTWGVGSIGGAVNLVTKSPQAEDFTHVTLGLGTAEYKRATLDVNRMLDGFSWGNGVSAFRINVVGHESGVDGRNWIHRERNGFAPSIVFGLDTPTRLSLAYEYINDYGNVDYGIPATQENQKPHHVGKWDNYWGYRNLDEEHNKSHRFTARLEHDFNDNIQFSNQMAWGKVDRTYTVSTPSGTTPTGAGTYRRLRGPSRDSTNEILSNQTNVTFKFNTGIIEHSLVTGLEYSKEKLDLKSGSLANALPTGSIPIENPNDPTSQYPGDTRIQYTGRLEVEAETKSYYILDTMKFNEQWQLNLGARQDHYDARDKRNSALTRGVWVDSPLAKDKEKLTSVNGAIVYKPVENGSIYFSYSNARSPGSLTAVSQFGVGDNASSKGKTYEIGTKWDLFDERLSLTAAVFDTERNTTFTDTLSGVTRPSNGEERVRGIELGASGNITEQWSVYAGYAYQDSEITKGSTAELGGTIEAEEGVELNNTPKHSFNLWTTYQLPHGFDVSYGARYVGELYINPGRGGSTTKAGHIEVPSYWVHDAALGYRVNDNVKLRLNLNNLLNKHYWRQYNGRGFGQPGEGRGAQLTAEISF